jgi:hypothetical protein
MNFMSRFLRLLLGVPLLSAYYPSAVFAEDPDEEDVIVVIVEQPDKKKKKKKKKGGGGSPASITDPTRPSIDGGNTQVKLDRGSLEGDGLIKAQACVDALKELAAHSLAVHWDGGGIDPDPDNQQAKVGNQNARKDATEAVKRDCEGVLPDVGDTVLHMTNWTAKTRLAARWLLLR